MDLYFSVLVLIIQYQGTSSTTTTAPTSTSLINTNTYSASLSTRSPPTFSTTSLSPTDASPTFSSMTETSYLPTSITPSTNKTTKAIMTNPITTGSSVMFSTTVSEASKTSTEQTSKAIIELSTISTTSEENTLTETLSTTTLKESSTIRTSSLALLGSTTTGVYFTNDNTMYTKLSTSTTSTHSASMETSSQDLPKNTMSSTYSIAQKTTTSTGPTTTTSTHVSTVFTSSQENSSRVPYSTIETTSSAETTLTSFKSTPTTLSDSLTAESPETTPTVTYSTVENTTSSTESTSISSIDSSSLETTLPVSSNSNSFSTYPKTVTSTELASKDSTMNFSTSTQAKTAMQTTPMTYSTTISSTYSSSIEISSQDSPHNTTTITDSSIKATFTAFESTTTNFSDPSTTYSTSSESPETTSLVTYSSSPSELESTSISSIDLSTLETTSLESSKSSTFSTDTTSFTSTELTSTGSITNPPTSAATTTIFSTTTTLSATTPPSYPTTTIISSTGSSDNTSTFPNSTIENTSTTFESTTSTSGDSTASKFTSTDSPENTTTETYPTTTTTSFPTSSTLNKKSTQMTTITRLNTSMTTSSTKPPVNCSNPPALKFGYVVVNSTSHGSVAKYMCHPGYKLSGNNLIVCQANGTWNKTNIKCSPVDCGLLTDRLILSINNTEEISYTPNNSTSFGSVALIRCKDGLYFSSGNERASFICSENGTWVGNFSIKCSAVYCGSPDKPNNTEISVSKTPYSVGSVVEYTCDSNYVLEGHRSRVCLRSGQWSDSSPTCRPGSSNTMNQCVENMDSRGQVWNKTSSGEIVVFPCSRVNENLSGRVTRRCSVEGRWSLPHYDCIRKEFEDIKATVNAIKEKPTAESVGHVLEQLSTLTNQTESNVAYSGELQEVTSTLEVIASINYTNINISDDLTTSFFETTSNLLDTSNTESWQAVDDQSSSSSEAPSGATKVLDVISTYTDAISSSFNRSGGKLSKSFDNLVLEVRRIEEPSDIKFPLDMSQNLSSSLSLSESSLRGSTTYSAVLYKNLTGMMSINKNFSENEVKLGSSVMSVKLDSWRGVTNFSIMLTFQHFETGKPTCSYRNASSVLWGKDGCKVKSSDTNKTVCECDHLTNFAILMSPWTEDNVETKAIRIISIVGCSVSMICLLITIITHICYWKYLKSDRVKILMNLCFALLISYGIFIGGVDRTSNKDVCTTVAVLLQYIYLVVFFLMLAEGVEISFVVLYVFTTKSRLKWILPLAWLMPALIVGISVAVTQTKGYGTEKACWLSIGLIWTFVGPALLVILVNFILMVLVLKAIFRTRNLSQKSTKERTIAGIRCLCVLLPLVGCTWVVGIFYFNEDMAWIQYIFAICNGLQGLAIFVFHCLLNTQIKHAYQRRMKYSSSTSGLFTRSTSNPIFIPRAKPSSSDLYNSINNSLGSETTFHLDRNFRERRSDNEILEMKHY